MGIIHESRPIDKASHADHRYAGLPAHAVAIYERARVKRAYDKGLATVLAGRSPSIHDLDDDQLQSYWAGVRAANARIDDARLRGYADGLADEPGDAMPSWYSDGERGAYEDGLAEASDILIARRDAFEELMREEQEWSEYSRAHGVEAGMGYED